MPKNQATTTLSPFTPVVLQPLLTPDGYQSSRYSVLLDPENNRFEAGIVSGDYQLIPNRDVVDVAENILQQSRLNFSDQQTIFNGRRFRKRFLVEQLSR